MISFLLLDMRLVLRLPWIIRASHSTLLPQSASLPAPALLNPGAAQVNVADRHVSGEQRAQLQKIVVPSATRASSGSSPMAYRRA